MIPADSTDSATLPLIDDAAITRCLSEQEGIVAAWLFGSQATGRARPDSDVDVAVLLTGESDVLTCHERRLTLSALLEKMTGNRIEIVVLNCAPPVLQHEILAHGRRLFEHDREARVAFEVRAGKIYADLAPMRAFFADALRRELDHGGLGGRQ